MAWNLATYNGFPGDLRERAGHWLNAEYQAGRLARPTRCRDFCGQNAGTMSAHAEDYSEPFGPHIAAYELCYTCHMMLHSRFRWPDRWREYVELVRTGWCAAPVATGREGWTRLNRYLSSGPRMITWQARPTPVRRETFDFLAALSLRKSQLPLFAQEEP